MLRKRGVRTDATRIKTDTPPRDPGAMSGLLTGVSFIAGVGGAVALADSPYPRPGSEPAEVRRYFTENSRSARLSATGQLISTASLARFTVSVARLAARSGQGSRGLRAAALAGGGLAVASLATSGLHTLALSGRWGKEDESAAKLARRSFVFGGPIHGVGFGVLTGALALAELRTGELPRPVAIIGLVSAASGLLSPLYFLKEQAGWFIPVGRFSGLLVSGISGVRLGRRQLPEVLSCDGGQPGPRDAGQKDTVNLEGGNLCVIAKFDRWRGKYVFHCHNLEHEDMMANFEVV